MAKLIELQTLSDKRGALTVIEDLDLFEFKRVFFIYNTSDMTRGGHRHKKTRQLLICTSGSCTIHCNNGSKTSIFIMDTPTKGLLVEPEDWHTMEHFSKDCVLLSIASENYDEDDYINEPYDD